MLSGKELKGLLWQSWVLNMSGCPCFEFLGSVYFLDPTAEWSCTAGSGQRGTKGCVSVIPSRALLARPALLSARVPEYSTSSTRLQTCHRYVAGAEETLWFFIVDSIDLIYSCAMLFFFLVVK